MIRFFKFHWIQTADGQIVNQNDGIYYTSEDNHNLDDMRDLIMRKLEDKTAVISFPSIEPITQAEYEFISGKPFAG